MGIVVLIIALFGCVSLFINSGSMRMAFMKGVLGFSLLSLLIPELLSLFDLISYQGVFFAWCFVDLLLLVFLARTKKWSSWIEWPSRISTSWNSFSRSHRILTGFGLLVILLTFVQGIIYPPNNWDSMSYHMARIVHWIQNGNLEHYITPHYSQLISPPFAEMMILQINLLAGNDYFSNSIQWFFMVSSLIPVSLIAKKFRMDRAGQMLSMLFMITLPEVVLLASSTHTELVTSFYMLCALYFMHQTLMKKNLLTVALLGLSLGFAVATKSTAFIYLAPFVVVWISAYAYQIFKRKIQASIPGIIVMLTLFVLPNLGHTTRNFKLNHQVFGTNETIHNYYVNEAHSLPFFISNVSRNISLQFGVPHVAPAAFQLVDKLHQILGVDLNQPEITSHTFGIDPLATHENNGANLFHTILLLFSLLYLIIYWKKQHHLLLIYTACIVFSFLIFCWYLKWQPWAKLHVSFYILYAVVIAQFLKSLKWSWLRMLLNLGLVATGLIYLLFNYSRPFITWPPFTSEIQMSDTRYEKYFSRFPEYYPDYKRVNELIKDKNFKNIGLLLNYHEMEYQLFTDVYRSDLKSYHLNGHEITQNMEPQSFKMDALISTTCQENLEINGKIYRNITPENSGHLSLYIPD